MADAHENSTSDISSGEEDFLLNGTSDQIKYLTLKSRSSSSMGGSTSTGFSSLSVESCDNFFNCMIKSVSGKKRQEEWHIKYDKFKRGQGKSVLMIIIILQTIIC